MREVCFVCVWITCIRTMFTINDFLRGAHVFRFNSNGIQLSVYFIPIHIRNRIRTLRSSRLQRFHHFIQHQTITFSVVQNIDPHKHTHIHTSEHQIFQAK